MFQCIFSHQSKKWMLRYKPNVTNTLLYSIQIKYKPIRREKKKKKRRKFAWKWKQTNKQTKQKQNKKRSKSACYWLFLQGHVVEHGSSIFCVRLVGTDQVKQSLHKSGNKETLFKWPTTLCTETVNKVGSVRDNVRCYPSQWQSFSIFHECIRSTCKQAFMKIKLTHAGLKNTNQV